MALTVWPNPSHASQEAPNSNTCSPLSGGEEEEAVAQDLDMHQLILGQGESPNEEQPVKTAEEVIKEIDDIMQVTKREPTSALLPQLYSLLASTDS